MSTESLLTIITVAVSLVFNTVITTLVGLWIKNTTKKRFNEHQELNNLRATREREERKVDVLTIFRKEFASTAEKVTQLTTAMQLSTQGIVTLLREFMKRDRDIYRKRGYISASELANWHELFNTYKELGGNHFREYVNEWLADVEALPRQT